MCGIFCVVTTENSKLTHLVDFLKDQVSRRGPNFQGSKKWIIENQIYLYFSSSILWMQGEKLVTQPIESTKSIFLYNGNMYGGITEGSVKLGDSFMLLNLFENTDNISNILSNVEGPYAFIYLDKINNALYFGRDRFGRISMLLGKNNDTILLSSVAKKGSHLNFIELPSVGTFCLDLKSSELSLIPWQNQYININEKLTDLEKLIGKNVIIKENVEIKTPIRFFGPKPCQLDCLKKLQDLNADDAYQILLNDPIWLNKVLNLKDVLELSVKRRITTQPHFCKNCIGKNTICNHSLVGILFSGGVDCAILALLSDKIMEKDCPIDLMNVAFNEIENYDSPDRHTGLQTLNELREICPDRDWNFMTINVSEKELEEGRKSHISDLIFPLQTVLDDSLGCALWFASRGVTDSYTSPSRVLLAGMGADELFGGYTKHRAAFKNGSWLGLHKALDVDWNNLPYRNLGRDNRVTCDHGRDLRLPYLDEHVVEFVRSLPCWEKTCPIPELPQGFGEKLLLRLLAYHLGLRRTSLLKKRALQFGCRIANKKENAHEISQRLL